MEAKFIHGRKEHFQPFPHAYQLLKLFPGADHSLAPSIYTLYLCSLADSVTFLWEGKIPYVKSIIEELTQEEQFLDEQHGVFSN